MTVVATQASTADAARAKRGLLEEGHVPLAQLAHRAPWDDGER